MSCGAESSRDVYQAELARLNAPWITRHAPELLTAADGGKDGAGGDPDAQRLRADGDADVEPGALLEEFVVPSCDRCGGILKVGVWRGWVCQACPRAAPPHVGRMAGNGWVDQGDRSRVRAQGESAPFVVREKGLHVREWRA